MSAHSRSGGDPVRSIIRLQREPIAIAAEVEKLIGARNDVGAVVTFTGICRADENGTPIAALTLEHYAGMAEAEIARHVEEACARWPLLGALVIHRYGRIKPGDLDAIVAYLRTVKPAQ